MVAAALGRIDWIDLCLSAKVRESNEAIYLTSSNPWLQIVTSTRSIETIESFVAVHHMMSCGIERDSKPHDRFLIVFKGSRNKRLDVRLDSALLLCISIFL